MKIREVAHYQGKTYDIWLGRRGDASLVMEGFLKTDGAIKHLVSSVKSEWVSEALNLLSQHGRPITRPYLLGQGCDGSITTPVLALYLNFCARHTLDALALYREAYPDEGELEIKAIKPFAEWQGVELPYVWTAACFANLLESLSAINYHMLRSVVGEYATGLVYPGGVLERGGYVAFGGNTRTYGPSARFTWGHVVTPTGEKVWQYDPWQSKNGVVPNHYWLSLIAIAAGQDGNTQLKRQVIEEALRVSRSESNKTHYRWWLERLDQAHICP